MNKIADLVIEAADAETLRSILKNIPGEMIETAIAQCLGFYHPAFAGAGINDCTPINEPDADFMLTHDVDLIKRNCSTAISYGVDVTGLILSVKSMKKTGTAKIDTIRWIRNETGCTLKDAKFVADTVYNS